MFDYALSPRMQRARSWISLGMMVAHLAWISYRLVSSNNPTRYASAASCCVATIDDWNLKSVLKSWAISLTSRYKGIFLIRSSMLFWYFWTSRRATIPGLNQWGFFTPKCNSPRPESVRHFHSARGRCRLLGHLRCELTAPSHLLIYEQSS